MSTLEKSAQQAQRRLWLNRWLTALGWTLTGAALLFVLVVIVERIWIASDDTGGFFGLLAVVLAAGAFIAAIIWSALTRESITDAAAKLDVAAGLKERISSGLYCERSKDPFSRAVVTDARRISRNISVNSHLPLQVPGSAGYAGTTFLIALLIFWLFPAVDISGKQKQRRQEQERTERVTRTIAQVKPILQQQAKKKDKNTLLEKEFEALEPLQQANLQTPDDVRREASKRVEKVGQKLQNKLESSELAKVNEFKKMMRRLAQQKNETTPIGKLTQSLAQGDFKSAIAAIDALKAELAKTPKTPEEKQRAEELKKQLNQLSLKLTQMAQDDKKMRRQLTKVGLNEEEIKRLLEKLKNNDPEAVKKMLADKGLSKKQIEKLMKQMKSCRGACKGAQTLAQSLAMAGAAGDSSGMSQSQMEGLNAAGEQLSELEALQQEINQLNASLADLNYMQRQLGNYCKGCGGKGCRMCKGPGPGMGGPGQGQGGIASEQVTPFKTVPKKTPTHMTRGKIISQRWVEGEQYKGEATQEFMDANIAAQRDVADAIEREQIPRMYHSSLRQYFGHTPGEQPAGNTGEPQNNQ